MLTIIAWIVALSLSLPLIVLAVECAVGSIPARPRSQLRDAPPFTILMPAHDEAQGIGDAIRAVRAQMRSHDQLIVIADNCSDATASIARALGSTVVERFDSERRGKGYALEAARAHVDPDPQRTIIVVDADCIPQRYALRHLAAAAHDERAAVQATNLLSLPPDASPLVRVSCFAFLVKNLVRQRALQRMAGVALLQGTGMAFPQRLYARIDWGGGSLVEDLDLGVRLIAAGERVMFDDRALFLSPASSEAATVGQRRRWEHGMTGAIARNAPLLLRAAIATGRARLLIVALDQVVPPTVMLVTIALGVWLAMLIGFGQAGPALTLTLALASLAVGLAVAWWSVGRQLLPADMLGQLARYMIWKLPIGLQFLTRREGRWVRTEREP
jgi:cellulose synthase/poly-beta-1,6-N-acetylglucosamine synthase-like glycosyltransferase